MDSKKMKLLLKDLFKTIEGDWLLIGGALLHTLNLTDRETLDIDIVSIKGSTEEDQLRCIDIALKHGLPPDAINFASTIFVKKQKNWKEEIILLYEGKRGRIYRPSKKLFRNLKKSRATDIDLLDIELYESYNE